MFYVSTPFGFLTTRDNGATTVTQDSRAAKVFCSFVDADQAAKENARNMPEHMQWFSILVPALGDRS